MDEMTGPGRAPNLGKRVFALAGMAALMIGVAACSGSVTGGGTPATTTTPPTSSDVPATTSSSSLPLAETDPCTLLPANAATSIGFPASGQPGKIGTAPACDYEGTSGAVGIIIRTTGGLSTVPINQGPVTDIKVGNHQAKQLVDSTGYAVFIGVTANSRVEIEATMNDQKQACPTALSIAKAVEPNLPSS